MASFLNGYSDLVKNEWGSNRHMVPYEPWLRLQRDCGANYIYKVAVKTYPNRWTSPVRQILALYKNLYIN